MTPARKGVGAMLIAYAILFTLIVATLGVVLLGSDRSEAIVSLRPASTADAATKADARPTAAKRTTTARRRSTSVATLSPNSSNSS